MNNKKPHELYISDVAESEKRSREFGDVQIITPDKEVKIKVKEEKVGNQKKEYYKE